jgi:hypothetical protein
MPLRPLHPLQLGSGGRLSWTSGMTGARYVSNWLLVLAALAIAVSMWVFVAQTLTHPASITLPPARTQARAIVWDNRVFSSRVALASWLASHGTTYQRWARLHRADAAIVEHVPARAFTPPPSQEAAGTSRRSGSHHAGTAGRSSAQVAGKAPASGASSGSSSLRRWAPILLLVLGTLVMLAAVVPAALVQLHGMDWFSVTRRTYVFALGFSISVGVLIAGVHV